MTASSPNNYSLAPGSIYSSLAYKEKHSVSCPLCLAYFFQQCTVKASVTHGTIPTPPILLMTKCFITFISQILCYYRDTRPLFIQPSDGGLLVWFCLLVYLFIVINITINNTAVTIFSSYFLCNIFISRETQSRIVGSYRNMFNYVQKSWTVLLLRLLF